MKPSFFALPHKSLLSLGLIAFCSMLCEGAMFDWGGIYFKKVVLAKPALVGVGYTAFMSTMALSRFVADYFTHRYGFKRIIQASGIIIMSGLLLAVLMPLFLHCRCRIFIGRRRSFIYSTFSVQCSR